MLAWPVAAHAHLTSTGFGPFYDGLTHLTMSPDDILGILAISLLAGSLSTRHGRWVLFILPAAWIAGGVMGILWNHDASLDGWNAISILVVGALVAADWKLPVPLVAVLALALGILHGFLNGAGMGRDSGSVLALTGIATGCFAVVALASALAVSLRATRAKIVVRVAGSWIAAIGLLMLGWTFRASMPAGSP